MSGSHSTPIAASKDQHSYNIDAVSNQGQFHASRPRDHPMMTGGHQPGRITSPSDTVPTFHAQTMAPGSAPPERTFQPNAAENTVGDSIFPTGIEGMPGATSGDVHQGLGHPGSGMTSKEVHHDGQHKRTRQRLGLAKHATGQVSQASEELGGANPRQDPRQRGLGHELPMGNNRGNKGERVAEDLPSDMA
ncbi:hypothetical protein BZA05DRAFT_38365 [Tricharina praecox]|uniref:uncharacterized protein n=1 Tax=Tricharina praecox TaxID=43433 RepID=UPI00222049FB|nr:uncharacterized protein BZA05DRAFT_38365 [Tricharina praecox]KAI5852195.1 hypothetical protein BZA05DRAFT_38365 [Tricharina praecox]